MHVDHSEEPEGGWKLGQGYLQALNPQLGDVDRVVRFKRVDQPRGFAPSHTQEDGARCSDMPDS